MPVNGSADAVSGDPPGTTLSPNTLGRAVLVFAAILATGAIAIAPPNWGGRLAIWLLGSGIALAAVIRWGTIQWIPIYLADVAIDVLNKRAPVPALLAALGLPAGVMLTVWLLRRYRFDTRFERSRDIPLFVTAGLIGMALPALCGVGVYSVFYPIDPMDNTPWTFADLLRWWLNDFVGLMLLGPLLVALRKESFDRMLAQPLASFVSVVAMLSLVVLMMAVPSEWAGYEFAPEPVLVAATVLVIVACLRFGLVPAATAALVLSGTAVFCFAFDVGMFRSIEIVPGLVMLWSHLSAMIGAVLLLTWLLAEQRRLEHRYEQVFETCPQPLWVYDQETLRFLLVNAAAERQYGYSRSELLASTVAVLASSSDETRSLPALLDSAAAQPIAMRHRTRNGVLIDVEVFARLIDYGGSPAWLVFAFDVSERKALESALMNAVVGEQRRLGQELHDGLAQELTVASLLTNELTLEAQEQRLPILKDLEALGERITASIRSARTMAHGLSPLTSSQGDLGAALTLLAKSSNISDTLVASQTHIEADMRLPLESRNHLYRIAQEAVQNALKHAGATRIDIRLTVRKDEVLLEILDDGRGIRHEEAWGSGFGTNTMRYRSSAINGQLSMGPRVGGGTVVVCSVLQPPARPAAAALR